MIIKRIFGEYLLVFFFLDIVINFEINFIIFKNKLLKYVINIYYNFEIVIVVGLK